MFNQGVGDVTDTAWSSKVLSVSLNLLHANTACMPAPLSPVFHSPLSTFFSAAQAPPLFLHTAVRDIQTLPVYCSLSKQIALYSCALSSSVCIGLHVFSFIGLFTHMNSLKWILTLTPLLCETDLCIRKILKP